MISPAGAARAMRRISSRPSVFFMSQRPPAAAVVRQMSVITLSDQEAVDRFRMTNQKSVLYFTAVSL